MKGSRFYPLYQLAWSSLDWLYPPSCGGCGLPGERWCPACRAAVRELKPPLCPHCGQMLAPDQVCLACPPGGYRFRALRAWAEFSGPLRGAIHRLKYNGDMALGESLARPLAGLLRGLAWRIDLVCPVPMGVARQQQRGYNQATLLALPLALACGLPYRPGALQKVRQTRTQVGLSRSARRQNVAGAFQAEARLVQGKTVLVVDDVATSGATLDACAAAVLDAGAQAVYGLTLARAIYLPEGSAEAP
ncbi:MAG TPA: ComF family protein [Anaerolineales bacterium]|nr:ComF family protein [Anaerolineales bacterium]